MAKEELTRESLVQAITELNEGEGFDIEETNEQGDSFFYGLRFTSLIDAQIMVVGSYGGHMKVFSLLDYYHSGKDVLAEDIAKYILDMLENPDSAIINHVVSQF